jgi:hypothetical protein
MVRGGGRAIPGRSRTLLSCRHRVARRLARQADRATANATAAYLEYPTAQLQLNGPAWPWRPTALVGAALLISALLGLLATFLGRLVARRHDTRQTRPVSHSPQPVPASTAAGDSTTGV